MYTLTVIIKILLIAVPLLLAVAWFTLLERKIMAGIHRRRGPNVVGAWGLLQPLADGLKLILKETILPSSANTVIFIIAPILTFMQPHIKNFDYTKRFLLLSIFITVLSSL